jgi:hypothetical protein
MHKIKEDAPSIPDFHPESVNPFVSAHIFRMRRRFESVVHSNNTPVRTQSVSRETRNSFLYLDTTSAQQVQLSARRHFVQLSTRRNFVQLSTRRHKPFERRCHLGSEQSAHVIRTPLQILARQAFFPGNCRRII